MSRFSFNSAVERVVAIAAASRAAVASFAFVPVCWPSSVGIVAIVAVVDDPFIFFGDVTAEGQAATCQQVLFPT